jgi:hypothetical protein
VEATDESIGKIDAKSDEASSSYVAVDTGFWIIGKKRLIPAGAVTSVDHDDEKVNVSMTKDEIKNAPGCSGAPGAGRRCMSTRDLGTGGP